MPKALLSDLSKTLLFARDPAYSGTLNGLHRELSASGPSYDFWANFQLDEALFTKYLELSQQIPVYLYTTGNIQEVPVLRARLGEIFNHTFAVSRLDWPKNDGASYKKIAARIGEACSDIVYVDDSTANLEVAKAAGLQTLQRVSSDQVIRELKELIS